MPNKPIDYSNTVMYKFVCNDLAITKTYVGHTTDFRARKCAHKSACNKPNGKKYNLKIYEFIRSNGGWDNWTMLQFEEFPCENEHEATLRERYWYELLNCELNSIRPIRSNDERLEQMKQHSKQNYTNNRDTHLEYQKQYIAINRERIKEQQKQYRNDNKEKILEYKKQYRNDNREQILEKKKQNYIDNKERINERRRKLYQEKKNSSAKTIV